MNTVSTLTYRLYREKDLPGILQLWEIHSGWGAITKEQFHDWYFNTPYGKCLIAIALDEEEEVIGQMVFMPSRVVMNGQVFKALRGMAPILKDTFRTASLLRSDHPTVGMYRVALEEAVRKGYELFYALPVHGWLSWLRAFPRFRLPEWQTCSLDCISLSLLSPEHFVAPTDGFDIGVVKGFSDEYPELWREAVRQYPIRAGIDRTRQWLEWKNNDNLILEVRDQGDQRLTGCLVVRKNSNLVIEALARNERELRQIFRTALYGLHHLNPQRIEISLTELKVMNTAVMKSVLSDLHPESVNFKFAFGAFPLTKSAEQHLPSLDQWHIMPND